MARKTKRTERDSDYLELKGFLSFLILHELSMKSLCGDELSKKIGERKRAPLTPGTIYPALKRLRKKKLVAYRRKGRKKMYMLTDEGKHELEHLYELFSIYFYGLKHKIQRRLPGKKRGKRKK